MTTAASLTHGMFMRYPATRWQDAMPVGSGVVGALVYGNIRRETIVLNHDAHYAPVERPPAVSVADQLPEVRRLIREGSCAEAQRLMPDVFAQRAGRAAGNTSSGVDPYQPLCSLELLMETAGAFRNYRRQVDFTTGVAQVQWTDDAASFTRELFASRLSDHVLLRIRSDHRGMVTGSLGLVPVANEQGSVKSMAGTEADLGLRVEQSASSAECRLSFTGVYTNGHSFGAVGTVTCVGGSLGQDGDRLVFSAADEVVVRVRLWVGTDASGEVTTAFDDELAEHAAKHAELFHRVSLSLGPDAAATDLSNEELLMQAYGGDVPTALIQRMFEFGRYLLISSSRPGSWPANLQGIWNGDYAPAWNSDFHTDENIQMNYWQALPGALPETILPLFDYFERHCEDFRANARNTFGCRGVLVPIAMTTNGLDAPRVWSNWTGAAGWIAQHFYDYFLFTGDRDFLRTRVVPWLKDTALFYEDFLLEEDGQLVFIPSLSPENKPTGCSGLVTINATMDVAICREVLSSLCAACELLDIEEEGVTRWRSMLTKLPAYQINQDGAMREWLHPDFPDNYHHRHQSHVYPVFPGLEVTRESDPEIFEACRVAVEKRLVIGLTSQTGWSMSHMANIYARLGEGQRALDCLELLTRSSTGPNLFTYHNDWRSMGMSMGKGKQAPFQIDANLGITAAVFEMLVLSKPGLVRVLPGLPPTWTTGQATGIWCRGGITLDLEWDCQAASLTVTITSRTDQDLRLGWPDHFSSLVGSGVGHELDEHGCLPISLQAGEPLQLKTPEQSSVS